MVKGQILFAINAVLFPLVVQADCADSLTPQVACVFPDRLLNQSFSQPHLDRGGRRWFVDVSPSCNLLHSISGDET